MHCAHRTAIVCNGMKFGMLLIVRQPATHDELAILTIAVSTVHLHPGAFKVKVYQGLQNGIQDKSEIISVTFMLMFVCFAYAELPLGGQGQESNDN